ncbi:response regulator [Actinoplanes teichomyceticus]|uniref:LuxR family two component transcriptional regulator n=1 Tax=Actinoplanes teichomyceticus TaxID=1867 RepID=A0A561VMB6_ACTTI|nr:response regulator transcription factor [Actinoplanes teichomyceticus]TWG12737.1 LuxR family two component transcriptional regulator [Actinoplanes teichomyceticus]GIF13470.1 DNA-binding response regulator [Actinoplanes teichomyceticus]
MTARPVRVAVVDDHPVFRFGMAALLRTLPGTELVGEATDRRAATALVAAQRPDVVLMDLHLGAESGQAATAAIRREHPEVAVLVITAFDDEMHVLGALRAGAAGYLLKSAGAEEIERAIHAVANGELLLGRAVAGRALDALHRPDPAASAFPQLTEREREVLDQVARGLDNATVARRLALSPKTVRNHVSSVLLKLQVSSRGQAIVAAREAGLGVDRAGTHRG